MQAAAGVCFGYQSGDWLDFLGLWSRDAEKTTAGHVIFGRKLRTALSVGFCHIFLEAGSGSIQTRLRMGFGLRHTSTSVVVVGG